MNSANQKKRCETIIAGVANSISRHDMRETGEQLELFAANNDDLVSLGMRRITGDLVVQVGDHENEWNQAVNDKCDGIFVVPISYNDTKWGDLEIKFKPLYSGTNQFFSDSLLKLLGVVALLVGTGSWFFLRRILSFLDPSRAVPPRVRDALNSFAEGILVLDTDDRIVLANATFAKYLDKDADELLGTEIWSLNWQFPDLNGGEVTSKNLQSEQWHLADDVSQTARVFSVNSSPVLDENSTDQGTMLAFTDVTQLERNRSALLSTLEDLSQSKKEIAEQNEELRYLATRDPLTSCVNRRTFFELFEKHWSNAKSKDIPLCGIMVDIDFFKPINDNYGHSMGDEVLRQTGSLLNSVTRKNDIVCRYGGEEFAILMPGLDLAEAETAAEAIRVRLSEMQFPEFSITASLGLSSSRLGAEDPQDMLDQADKCLYVAKRNGRNQVIRFDTVPSNLVVDESKIQRTKLDCYGSVSEPKIPFAAVTALLSALSFRDLETGRHSTRVATYAALLAQRVLNPKDVFVVEMAALLHDIGKVGVPDAILLKPGPLTEQEWALMEKHDRIGVEIINRSFKHSSLTEIVKYHHYRFDGSNGQTQGIVGENIPIGARILTIVDSFDAMVSNRPYRKGMPLSEAIAELRRCAGTQFDPILVEHFINVIQVRGSIRNASDPGRFPNDVVLRIGEQIESIIEAADSGDGTTFMALAERLRSTALQHNVDSISDAASHAIAIATEDAQLENLVKESFELLAVCRELRVNLATNHCEEESVVAS
jgi:diguanylate cyclase (GGDEF)-like protein/putative nucleotidyltransferase with HDIG domain